MNRSRFALISAFHTAFKLDMPKLNMLIHGWDEFAAVKGLEGVSQSEYWNAPWSIVLYR